MLDGAPDGRPEPAAGPSRRDGWRLVIGLVLWAVVAAMALVAARPPAALDVDAPADVASGGRAMEVLRRLAREDGERVSPPRPVGTAANARCRDRIVAECRRVGLYPEVDERFAVSTYQNVAGTTRNVVARMRGSAAYTDPGRAILCMAHYDSVGAGPGIGDDLSGVATLVEVARALKAGGGTRRDVIFLFEDAEEHGLLGAEAFATHHPWAEDVGVVVNFEARGTSGPSRMFETGAGNAWALDALAGTLQHPSATSVSVEVYRRMPNDTDYTVWRQRGVPGLNFAFIGDVTRYHTPLDDLEHLSPGTLQHHATNALDAVRALDGAEFPVERGATATAGGPDAVFFDAPVLGLVVIEVGTMRLVAALTLLLALVGVGRGLATGALGGLRLVIGLVAVAAALVLAGGVGWLDRALIGVLGAPPLAFPAHPGPITVSVIGATIGGLCIVAMALRFAVPAAECGAAVLISFAFGGFVLSWQVPGAAYLFVIPAFVFALAATLMRTRGDVGARWGNASLFALPTAALLWTGLHAGVVDAFGVAAAPVISAPLLLIGAFALPLLVRARRSATPWVAAGSLGLALVSAGFAGTLEPHSRERPGKLNLVHVQEEGETPRWQVTGTGTVLEPEVVDALRIALGMPERSIRRIGVPWSWQPLFAAETLPIDDPEPTLEVVSTRASGDVMTAAVLRIRSPRGGDQLTLQAPNAEVLRIDGVAVQPWDFRILGPGDEPHEIEVTATIGVTISVDLFDKRFGLDPVLTARAESFLEARPGTYVPAADGDGSVVIGRYLVSFRRGGEVLVSRPRAETDSEPDGATEPNDE